MLRLDAIWEERRRVPVLLASGAIVLVIAIVDWRTKPEVSLGLLYMFPVMLAAGFLPRWLAALLALACAMLSTHSTLLDMPLLRLAVQFLTLAGCGLFVAEWLRNRRLRAETQERLRILLETSPAAIVTVDERGFVEFANRAATDLAVPRDGRLVGKPIAAFFPELHHGLRWLEAPQFRTSIQCHGHRGSGESFLADVWCSTHQEGPSRKLTAIIADVTEKTVVEAGSNPPCEGQHERAGLSGRETDVLRFLVEGLANKEIAARMDISPSVVKYTLQQLFAKTAVRTRAQLVKVALEDYPDLLVASATATPACDLQGARLHVPAPSRGRFHAVPAAGASPYAAAHQAAYRVVRSGGHLSAQRAIAAKRAVAGGF